MRTLKKGLQEVKNKIQKKIPTLPVSLGNELETNIFCDVIIQK